MAGSQLKRLKASLREQGVIGPQQSKKQKRRNVQDGNTSNKTRFQKAATLNKIKEEFNPFDLKHNIRGPKFQVTTNKPATGNAARGIDGRPSEAKALSEERRRQAFLVEMNRNKVGGILDRRFGENDPTMDPQEKMLQRFVHEKRSHKRNSLFDLEDEPSEGLTHMGKSLFDGAEMMDDFNEKDLSAGSEEGSDDEGRPMKRARPMNPDDEDEDQPERKKSRQEVMSELIAKSKFYKAQRQQAKEEDDDLREELDQELSELRGLLFNNLKGAKDDKFDGTTPEPALSGKDKMERDYDIRLRQLAQDRRGQATERTKTDEEKAQEEVQKLKDLEEKKLRRMRGEKMEDSEDESQDEQAQPEENVAGGKFLFEEPGDNDTFGLGSGIRTRPTATELGFDDEDDFIVEDDLLFSGSELEIESETEDDDSDAVHDNEDEDEDDDDEFTRGLLNEDEAKDPKFNNPNDKDILGGTSYPCPQTLQEFVEITQGMAMEEVPSVIQKIRILHHPKLANDNKAKLANFSGVLPQYLHSSSLSQKPAFSTLEGIIRHTHSLAKTFPIEIANAFRSLIDDMGRSRPLSLNLGDLMILTAVGTIFPASDNYHQVLTPAMIVVARYLGHKIPQNIADFCRGAYLSTLALQWQCLAKRYIPELINFSLLTLVSLSPIPIDTKAIGYFPVHEVGPEIRISDAASTELRKLTPLDCVKDKISSEEASPVQVATIAVTAQILDAAADLFSGKISFIESFQPVSKIVALLGSENCKTKLPAALNERLGKLQTKLETMLQVARLARRPLELHHHRPLAIKQSVPRFEDSYDPNRHYDPDRERAELAKLKAEHKKERKGAMRDLRKDARFMAREKLRMKKQKDAAYEKKYKRLVAEIQGEEGREANAYEREKQMRKRAAKR
ncbi:nucleolar protein 14 [Biscogniauxia mediterranea]|nr:nucleolar protein 14 [Biscogniauxia mediterranea]